MRCLKFSVVALALVSAFAIFQPIRGRQSGRAYVREFYVTPGDANAKELSENNPELLIIEGDIAMNRNHGYKSVYGAVLDVSTWPASIIPYELSEDYPNRDAILKAIAHYNTRTLVKFIPRTNETNYLVFVLTDSRDVGGRSYMGMQRGPQPIWFNADVSLWDFGTVLHELGHALSLGHEHSRTDRDLFVKLFFENCDKRYRSQLESKYLPEESFGPYDYGSIMHYPDDAYSSNGKKTIVPLTAGAVIGQRTQLSTEDIKSINHLYMIGSTD